jgi:hypothetical protein
MESKNRIQTALERMSTDDRFSIHVLGSVQNAEGFRLREGNVVLYKRNTDGELRPTSEFFTKEKFLKAVDYYYKNRALEVLVDLAMTKPDGEVDVYEPGVADRESREVVLRIKNYKVPQILELAYLILRTENKNSR